MRIEWMALLALLSMGGAALSAEEGGDPGDTPEGVFAVVGSTVIPMEEFETNFHLGMRQRFFHGNVPEAQMTEFRHEVAQALVDRVLLLQEAERRGLRPDETWVEAQLQQAERRIAFATDADEAREALRQQLLGDSAITQLRMQIEAGPAPGRAELLAYYRAHPDKFTTPERLRVSLILLKVEPWSPSAAWQAASDEAARIVKKIRGGERFEDLARLHSADGSAAHGGDLGYVHKGMLAEEAQRVVDTMRPGEISDPIHLLQGFAILRLDERVAPVLNDFQHAEERVRELLTREKKEETWQALVSGLRARTPVRINEAALPTGE